MLNSFPYDMTSSTYTKPFPLPSLQQYIKCMTNCYIVINTQYTLLQKVCDTVYHHVIIVYLQSRRNVCNIVYYIIRPSSQVKSVYSVLPWRTFANPWLCPHSDYYVHIPSLPPWPNKNKRLLHSQSYNHHVVSSSSYTTISAFNHSQRHLFNPLINV